MQSFFFLPGDRELLIEETQMINVKFRRLGRLPFLPRHIEIHRNRIGSPRRYFAVTGNDRRDFPARAVVEGVHGSLGGACRGNTESIGKLGIRKNAGLEELRCGQFPLVADRAQLGVGDHGQYGRLVGGEAIADIEFDGFQDRMLDLFCLDLYGFHARRRKPCRDRGLIQRHGLICRTGRNQKQE